MAPVPGRQALENKAIGTGGVLDDVAAEHAGDSGRLALFERMQKRGRKAAPSHKAKQRKAAGAEKEEAYNERLAGRVVKHNRRKERMDRLKNIY